MRLEFVLPSHCVLVDVDVVANPGTQAWVNAFDQYQTQAMIHDHLYVPEINVSNEDVYDLPRQHCLKILNGLSELGVDFVRPVPYTPAHVDANCLNQLHRFFTHTQQEYNVLQAQLSQQHQDPHKRLPAIKQIIQLLQDLNHCVHQMEHYCTRSHGDIVTDSLVEIKLYRATEFNASGWVDLTPYRQYHSDQPCDVILGSEVLGKTLLQSYIDGDDPTDWDTSGHHYSAGGLQICLNNTRQQIYNSDHFQSWLSKHSAVDLYYDFPIGNLKDWSQIQPVIDYLNEHPACPVNVTYLK
jgi:hypothetical protein